MSERTSPFFYTANIYTTGIYMTHLETSIRRWGTYGIGVHQERKIKNGIGVWSVWYVLRLNWIHDALIEGDRNEFFSMNEIHAYIMGLGRTHFTWFSVTSGGVISCPERRR